MTIAPRPPVAPPQVQAPARTARIRWSISPEALRLASGAATLVWTIDLDADDPRAQATLETPQGVTLLHDSPASVIQDSELTHIQIEHSLLSATLSADGRILYARTRLLHDLHIPGGRYEIVTT
ncbi:hypothetical protein PHYC_00913 [Phycisphaerales bacterium]|nr:hypothetical protein PHYC_00913 [Phycisphaerales bacterium]